MNAEWLRRHGRDRDSLRVLGGSAAWRCRAQRLGGCEVERRGEGSSSLVECCLWRPVRRRCRRHSNQPERSLSSGCCLAEVIWVWWITFSIQHLSLEQTSRRHERRWRKEGERQSKGGTAAAAAGLELARHSGLCEQTRRDQHRFTLNWLLIIIKPLRDATAPPSLRLKFMNFNRRI